VEFKIQVQKYAVPGDGTSLSDLQVQLVKMGKTNVVVDAGNNWVAYLEIESDVTL